MQEDVQALVRIKRDVLYGHDIVAPSVDPDRCNGCGLCVRVCPGLVLELRCFCQTKTGPVDHRK